MPLLTSPRAPALLTSSPKPGDPAPIWKSAAEENAALMDEPKDQGTPPLPDQQNGSQAPGAALVAALRTPKYGAERYIEERLNQAGGRVLDGRRRRPQYAYQSGPLKGMTQAQATERLRAEYAALPDAERMRYEDRANGNDIISPRERAREQQHFNAQAMDRGLGASPMAATSGGAPRPAGQLPAVESRTTPGEFYRPDGSGYDTKGNTWTGRKDPNDLRDDYRVGIDGPPRNGMQTAPAIGRAPSAMPGSRPGSGFSGVAGGGKAGAFRLRTPEEVAGRVGAPAPLSRPRLEPGGMTTDMARAYAANVNPDGTLKQAKPPGPDRIQASKPLPFMQSTLDGPSPSAAASAMTPAAASGDPGRPKLPPAVIRDKPLSGAGEAFGTPSNSPAGKALGRTFDSPELPAPRTKIAAALPRERMTGLAKLLA